MVELLRGICSRGVSTIGLSVAAETLSLFHGSWPTEIHNDLGFILRHSAVSLQKYCSQFVLSAANICTMKAKGELKTWVSVVSWQPASSVHIVVVCFYKSHKRATKRLTVSWNVAIWPSQSSCQLLTEGWGEPGEHEAKKWNVFLQKRHKLAWVRSQWNALRTELVKVNTCVCFFTLPLLQLVLLVVTGSINTTTGRLPNHAMKYSDSLVYDTSMYYFPFRFSSAAVGTERHTTILCQVLRSAVIPLAESKGSGCR
jgi:hypothetical protein